MIGPSLRVVALVALLSSLAWGYRPDTGNSLEFYAGGQPGAAVKIEVFSDYQCPACRTFYLDTIRNVLTDYAADKRVSVVYHDFPLAVHQFSREATRYALAAQMMGRDYWLRLTDALYADQSQWSQNGQIDLLAARVFTPLEYARLKQQLLDPRINRTLESEVALGGFRQIQSTPTFFITVNGREQKVVGGVSYTVMKGFLDRVLK